MRHTIGSTAVFGFQFRSLQKSRVCPDLRNLKILAKRTFSRILGQSRMLGQMPN